ncbi:filamentous hemagglutinin N-terminal domain-containing protein [Crenothrix polyspora]|uniref:Filamentous haemagglutinin FhaB/tRNA nuclease CdiA-like TPS domain-containing protein n=1 Tax=Crenothrix polyspora TaxID=360316 RepID=A0A1R4H9Q8_9GAMM|nr:filamentous hemagglutinin N-terminal domain-containing protein [Crenothrix polyspora]SJM92907.1 hypothetical protein CRENPOLYSF1_350017 [Crenothrix polyspora]
MKTIAIITVGISCVITVTPCSAEVITDGSVGAKLNLQGPNFHIGQDLGALKGNNLFHSFDRFNLNQSQSATFTGNSAIKNVISRVTGGQLSNIDGTLKSEVGKAAFYFINPAGIVFGENAQVDVPGAFYASTAGKLQFADGAKFSALKPHGNTLSMAAPEAFGFLGKQTGNIKYNGAGDINEFGELSGALVFTSGATVQLSAANININNAIFSNKAIFSDSGKGTDLQLAAVGNTNQTIGVTTLPNHALHGNISLNNTILDASGHGKGRITIRAENLNAVNSSQVIVDNLSDKAMQPGQGININVIKATINNSEIGGDKLSLGDTGNIMVNTNNELTMINGGKISSVTINKSNAGNIDIKAGTLKIIGPETGIYSSNPLSSGGGKSGNIKIEALHELAITNDGIIQSDTEGNANAGSIDVKAGEVLIDGQNSETPATVTGINSLSNSVGDVGAVKVTVQNGLALINGGVISSDTNGKGNAGRIDVKAGTIKIDGKDKHFAGISAKTGLDSRGNAGDIVVTATNDLVITKGGEISSDTFANGHAGRVDVKAGSIRIDGQGTEYFTGISSDANDSNGNAGAVKVFAKNELAINNGGQVSSTTYTRGDAGEVNVNAGTILINDSKNSIFDTGILSASKLDGTGNPGAVKVTAIKMLFMNKGQISISSANFADNPLQKHLKLIVAAPYIELSNNSKITAESLGNIPTNPIQINTSRLSLNNSSIKTSANQGNGGSITINAKDWARLHNSQITTSVASKEKGNGGDITINSDVLVMDTGFIQANTNATKASGGKINLNTKQLVASSANLQTGVNTPLQFIANSGNNVIQAAAPDGVNGNITINAPQLNIVGALASLNTPQLDLSRVGHDPCSNTARQSTIKKLGKGGIPLFNKGQDGYTIDRLLAKTPNKNAQAKHPSQLATADNDCLPRQNARIKI